MYVPPYCILKTTVHFDAKAENVTLPRQVFELLIAAAHAGHLDRDWYRAVYPDVADAVDRGQLGSELMHFAEGGYKEGRLPRSYSIDEGWYTRHYSDVEAAVASGAIASAHHHYNHVGHFEGRAPDSASEIDRNRWMQTIESVRSNGVKRPA